LERRSVAVSVTVGPERPLPVLRPIFTTTVLASTSLTFWLP